MALKVLRKETAQSVERQAKLELETLEQLNHPNIVRLIGVEWNAKYPKKDGSFIDVILLVLELAVGGEMFDFLQYTGSFEESIARSYFHQLIDAVEACHRVGIAHRDLKLENLLLDENFVLKVVIRSH